MPQEPKKRHSKARQGKRRASIHHIQRNGVICANCKNITLSHMVCKKCGYYDGQQVITVASETIVRKIETA